MEVRIATSIFDGLSSGVRLEVHRMLIKNGREGMVAGETAASLAMARPSASLLRRRAQGESEQIDTVRTQHASRCAVIPLLAEEPVGAERLLRLVQSEVAPAAT